MKKIYDFAKELIKVVLIVLAVFVFGFVSEAACSVLQAQDTITVGQSPISGVTWQVILAAIVGIYEVLVRTIPTVKNISILSVIMKLLVWLLSVIPNKKKTATSDVDLIPQVHDDHTKKKFWNIFKR